MTTRKEIIDAARSYMDVEFKWHGRSRSGLDCWGLPRVVCDRFDLLPGVDSDYVDLLETRNIFLKFLRPNAIEIPIDKAAAGDLILMSEPRNKEIVHCAFLGERWNTPSLIHCSLSAKKVIEISFTGAYRRLAITAFAIPGVE